MSEEKPIVSVQWLSKELNNPDVVVVDCRFSLAEPEWLRQQYVEGHIPSAYYLDLNLDLSAKVEKHGGRHPLPDPETLAAKIAAMGVNFGKTLVVAYDDSRFAFASRLWWLLRYLGHDKVALLDGGGRGWQAGGYPIDISIPKAKSGQFAPQTRGDWIVDREVLNRKKDLANVVVVDSRDSDRYLGEREPIDPIAGSIPNAVNSPWKKVSNADGYLEPISSQKKLWSDWEQAEEIIIYCGSGVTACVNLFSLELVGLKQGKLYPGGWSDWCSYLVN